MKEQERLSELQEARTEIQSEIAELQEAHAKETEKLDKTKERIQKQKLDLKRIDEIEAKPTLIGNKVTVDRGRFRYGHHSGEAYHTGEEKSPLCKSPGCRTQADSRTEKHRCRSHKEIGSATKETVRIQVRPWSAPHSGSGEGNDRLRSRLRTYEDVISKQSVAFL